MYRTTATTQAGLGSGLFLVTMGAILSFAVDITVSGLDLDVVGIILMTAGFAALIWSIIAIMAESGSSRRPVELEGDDVVVEHRRRQVM